MQNYGQQPPGYQRPSSTASFAGQSAAPPQYGASQGYQTAAPSANSAWAPPAQPQGQQQWNQTQPQGQWGQQTQQPAAGGYNPSTYGAMPGAYQQAQQQEQPPPPPPKPAGFAAAVQQQQTQQSGQNWGQQQAYGAQQNTGFTPQGQQSGYPQAQAQTQTQMQPQQPQPQQPQPQQQYNNAAPPPPSQTPGGSYFPPTQGGRPGSIYGAEQAGTYSTPSSAGGQQPPNMVMSPNEQQPAYIPPSLSGQGVQSYMPANTNPMPGVYVPPPPDIPAWQQANHAPLQGANKKFRYTKPTVDPSFYAQGYQPPQQPQFAQQPQPQPQPQIQPQVQPQVQPPQQPEQSFSQPQHQGQVQAGQFVPPNQPINQQFNQAQPPNQFQQQLPQTQPQSMPQQYGQPVQGQQAVQPATQFPPQQQENQWQPTPPADQGYGQQQQQQQPQPQQQQNVQGSYNDQHAHQQQWQPSHQTHPSISQQYSQTQDPNIQAPKPLGRTGTTPPNFVNQTSPQSQPVSPVQNRQSTVFASSHNLGRQGSVSSIAMGAIRHSQTQSIAKPNSPTPSFKAKAPTPPPPRDSKEKFSAIGFGGPSDWEHFGAGGEEVDDEEYFTAKKTGTEDRPAEIDSSELPGSHASPPSTTAWPTPPTQAAQPDTGLTRRDTYQPTPPPQSVSTSSQRPPSQPPQNTFAMGDTIVSSQSPKPVQTSQPPGTQQGFVMDDGGWAPPKQSSPAQPQQPSTAPAQQGFVMNDGGWTAQTVQRQQTPTQGRQQTPTRPQQQYAPPLANNTLVMNDGGWGPTSQTPTQIQNGWEAQTQAQNDQHIAELKAKDAELKIKDDAYARLRADVEKEKTDLCAEIERLKADIENAKNHAAGEKNVLNEQIESMKIAAEEAKKSLDTQLEAAKSSANALVKEKETTIEWLKEDSEGKEDTIKERDATIADLRRQLEAEKSKEPPAPPQPTPADLIPDIDPWYAGSLDRYIGMLRAEANEPGVEGKINIFSGFLKAESAIRGLEHYSAAPPAPPPQEPPPPTHREEPEQKKPEPQIQVPQRSDSDDHFVQYSPGGRPIVQQRPALKSQESVPTLQSGNVFAGPEHPVISNQSTTILTPASSVDDNYNKTPTPVQSPPEEPPQQNPQYKAYVPPAATAAQVQVEQTHRQSLSFAQPPSFPPLEVKKSAGNHDEIFFGDPQPASKPSSRPTTSASIVSDVPVPAPLSFTPQRSSTPAAVSSKKSPLDALKDLLPSTVSSPVPNAHLGDIRNQSREVKSDFSYITDITINWEKAAALARKKNDTARHKRQEESESRTDQLFNDNEISYADIGAIEDEFKEKERLLKAQEDRDEYKTYVEEVFDKVYDSLQSDIKSLMDFYIEIETLLHSSVSGVQAMKDADAPTTKEALELLKDLHEQIEVRHEKVVSAVAERDKRYKKTEIQPLYAAGNISKMKAVEKHFENAEKQAAVRANGDKAERVGELVRVTEDAVVRAVGVDQGELDSIVAAIKYLKGDEEGREEVLGKAKETLAAVKMSSKELLSFFNTQEMSLNTAVLDAEIAQSRAENADPSRIAGLEKEKVDGEKRINDEFERKVSVLDQDKDEVDHLLQEKGLTVQLSEEDEKKRRMKAALEEAKRRNGEL